MLFTLWNGRFVTFIYFFSIFRWHWQYPKYCLLSWFAKSIIVLTYPAKSSVSYIFIVVQCRVSNTCYNIFFCATQINTQLENFSGTKLLSVWFFFGISELEYAFALKKPLVPLLMQRDYVADGWLASVLGETSVSLHFTQINPQTYQLKKLRDILVRSTG